MILAFMKKYKCHHRPFVRSVDLSGDYLGAMKTVYTIEIAVYAKIR